MQRAIGLFTCFALAACGSHSLPPDEPSVVPATTQPEWYAPGFFIEFAGERMVTELYAELGGGGTQAVGPLSLTLEATSFDDYKQRLVNDPALHQRLSSSKAAGAQLIYQLHPLPRWVSSAPDDATLNCPDEPMWPHWATVPPDPAKWSDWEAFVELTVKELTVTEGYDNLWFQLWEEPNNPCYWSGTEAQYLELYAHTAAAVKRANPGARIGGPGVYDASGAIAPSTTPLPNALITSAQANALPLDFLSYHVFGTNPHRARNTARELDAALTAAGFTDTRLLISSFNPLDSATSPYWPNPPTPSPTGRIWEYDTEIGPPWVAAVSQAMAASGRHGALTLFQLDDFPSGGEYENDSGWGARTSEERHGIRKALYQGMRLMAQVPAPLLPVTVTDPAAGSDGADEPVGAIAAASGGDTVVVLWSYVAAPQQEATAVVMDDGFSSGLGTWDRTALEAFMRGTATVDAVTQVPAEQVTLEKAKRVFARQIQLVSRKPTVCVTGDGLTELRAAVVVDATHNNSYAAWKQGGLDAALSAGVLTASNDVVQHEGGCWNVTLEPYSVVSLRFAASATPSSMTVTVAQ